MKSRWLAALALLVMFAVGTVQANSDLICIPHGSVRGNLCRTSIARVIANPSQFDGKNVSMVGFLVNSPEGLILFSDSEASSISDIANGIELHLGDDSDLRKAVLSLNRSSVRVVGKFSSEPTRFREVEYSAGQLLDVVDIAKAGIPWGLRPLDANEVGGR